MRANQRAACYCYVYFAIVASIATIRPMEATWKGLSKVLPIACIFSYRIGECGRESLGISSPALSARLEMRPFTPAANSRHLRPEAPTTAPARSKHRTTRNRGISSSISSSAGTSDSAAYHAKPTATKITKTLENPEHRLQADLHVSGVEMAHIGHSRRLKRKYYNNVRRIMSFVQQGS